MAAEIARHRELEKARRPVPQITVAATRSRARRWRPPASRAPHGLARMPFADRFHEPPPSKLPFRTLTTSCDAGFWAIFRTLWPISHTEEVPSADWPFAGSWHA